MESCGTNRPHEKSVLRQFVDLPVVGEYMALTVAAIPLLMLLIGRGVLGVSGEIGGWFGAAASLLTWGWLIFIEKRRRVRLRLPVFRIPLLWLMPVYLVASIIELLS